MAYPKLSATDRNTVELPFDLIDKLVTVAEIIASHKATPDGDANKHMYLEVANGLNRQINDEMCKLGLKDLVEVRRRLELPIARIVNDRKTAFASLYNLIDVGI